MDERERHRVIDGDDRCLCSSLNLALLHSTLPLAIHSFNHNHSSISTRQEEAKKNTIIETT